MILFSQYQNFNCDFTFGEKVGVQTWEPLLILKIARFKSFLNLSLTYYTYCLLYAILNMLLYFSVFIYKAGFVLVKIMRVEIRVGFEVPNQNLIIQSSFDT